MGLLLAGCSEYWAKPGATAVDFGAARESCSRQAEAAFPPQMEQVRTSSGAPSPTAARCAPVGGAIVCSPTGIGFSNPTYTTLDQNTGPRERAFRDCLQAAGWQAVRSQQQADAITHSSH